MKEHKGSMKDKRPSASFASYCICEYHDFDVSEFKILHIYITEQKTYFYERLEIKEVFPKHKFVTND